MMKQFGFLFLMLVSSVGVLAQEITDEALEKAKRSSVANTYQANTKLKENKFEDAEADYRKAISDYGNNATARYNLGNAYYNKETYDEAMLRYKQAAVKATTKPEKHKAYHNLGNVYMKEKQYQQAVDAYKKALINNPKDDETRYNYALAKEMLEKEKQQNKDNSGGDQNNQNDGKDDKDKKENEGDNKQDQQNKDKGQNKDNQDNKDQGKDQQKDDNKGKEDQGKNGDGKEDQQKKPSDEQQKQQQQQAKSKASPEQIQRMLRAIEREDKRVREEQDAKKVKGVPVKTEKDW